MDTPKVLGLKSEIEYQMNLCWSKMEHQLYFRS